MSTTLTGVELIVQVITDLIVYGAYLLFFSFTLWMVVDAAKQDRFLWVATILGIPFVGSVVYYYTEKKHEYAKAESRHIHLSETESEHEKAPKKAVLRKKEIVKTLTVPENIPLKVEQEEEKIM